MFTGKFRIYYYLDYRINLSLADSQLGTVAVSVCSSFEQDYVMINCRQVEKLLARCDHFRMFTGKFLIQAMISPLQTSSFWLKDTFTFQLLILWKFSHSKVSPHMWDHTNIGLPAFYIYSIGSFDPLLSTTKSIPLLHILIKGCVHTSVTCAIWKFLYTKASTRFQHFMSEFSPGKKLRHNGWVWFGRSLWPHQSLWLPCTLYTV